MAQYAVLYCGPVCGPIFWHRMRPDILAQYAALYCGPILWPYILAPYVAQYAALYAALYCIVESILTSKREMSEKKGNE